MALQSGLDNDQGSFRRNATIYDQHVSQRFPKGRPWSASIDKKSGMPVGVIVPKGWTAPWTPDQSYFRFNEDEPNRFRIDYEAILSERIEEMDDYRAQLERAAVARGWNPDDPEKASVLVALIGPPPSGRELPAAAMQGNQWILGESDTPDPRLEKFVQKIDRRARLVADLPNYGDEPETVTAIETDIPSDEDELDRLLDLEEEVDPEASGGKRVRPKKKVA